MLCTAVAASASAPFWLFIIIAAVVLLILIIFFICFTCITRNKGDVYKGSLHIHCFKRLFCDIFADKITLKSTDRA
jgi:succinate dehydrogenase hydrophobic anchor subunit